MNKDNITNLEKVFFSFVKKKKPNIISLIGSLEDIPPSIVDSLILAAIKDDLPVMVTQAVELGGASPEALEKAYIFLKEKKRLVDPHGPMELQRLREIGLVPWQIRIIYEKFLTTDAFYK